MNGSTKSKRDSESWRQNCRKRLQGRFEECSENTSHLEEDRTSDRSVLSIISLNDDARRALRNGAERISKTFNRVRTSLGSFSQKFRVPTKRRHILEEGPMTPNCVTPHTFSKQILGRTPTKLYSPFGIETPYKLTTVDKEPYNPRI